MLIDEICCLGLLKLAMKFSVMTFMDCVVTKSQIMNCHTRTALQVFFFFLSKEIKHWFSIVFESTIDSVADNRQMQSHFPTNVFQ